jgi:SAM-dependent methyltransferase
LPLADHSADAAMLLRSWNHLRDPAQALDQLARVLRPGGRLLLVDNVVFGLVRDRQQLERAHALPLHQTPFEHFRNHDAPEAWALLQSHWGAAVRLLELHAVVPGSSNQWLLLVQLDYRPPVAEG